MVEEYRVVLRGSPTSVVDWGGPGVPMLALHGHFGRGRTFAGLAQRLPDQFRLISFDQRGHGASEARGDFSRGAYVADAAELLRQYLPAPAVVLGHSSGGVTAYQLAARYPDLVRALVVVDIGAVTGKPHVEHPILDLRGWPRGVASRHDLGREIEIRGVPDVGYFLDSAVERPDGWGFLFDYDDMMTSQRAAVGDYWSDWVSSSCPALLVRGGRSPLLSAEMARQMIERRPNAVLCELPGRGHFLPTEDPAGLGRAIAAFLLEACHEALSINQQ
ncbi:hypothetical protein GCM10012275_41450 [Longimycelium tulufanense]|uniref:AB hydrolase-1 domain-containing protein n=1 Tax=Longimycelium tulufanense TaxID=907463 RepID=A0A8J3CAS1_9PSEU|nr:alpha/beta hydrolase [Longimycelium tulufanense]GGM66673.1 hypothetical protein GCM10012275_41450 [Longimycelium tulufanense]